MMPTQTEELVPTQATDRPNAVPDVEIPLEGEQEFALDLRPTSLATLCQAALDDVLARFSGRRVEYAPDPERRGAGVWDPTRLAYAVAILLEDALQRAPVGEPIQLRWREHDRDVVVRVQIPRPLERGEPLVTFFDDGVKPENPSDTVGTLRLVVARKIALQHGGYLARVRTRGGTTHVLTLPRWTRPRG